MSHNRDTFVEQRFVGFPLMFPMTPKTRCSDVGCSRYLEKTPKKDLQQSVLTTKFENWQGMKRNRDTFVEQKIMGFPLTFPTTPKYVIPISVARDIAEKHLCVSNFVYRLNNIFLITFLFSLLFFNFFCFPFGFFIFVFA